MVPTTNNLRIIKTKNMKFSKLFLAFFLGAFTVSAQTYMPDDAFENWCENSGYGDSIPNNNTISTAYASFPTQIAIANLGISDLTGIEAFVSLTNLDCAGNNLDNIDISFLGNNLTIFNSTQQTVDLYCITVFDTAYAANTAGFFQDGITSYSTNCLTAFGCMDSLSCYYEPTHSIDTAIGGSCFYSVTNNLTADVCDTYLFGGLNRDTSGTYTNVLTTVDGCDSNVVLALTIRNSTASYDTTTATLCDNYIWNNLIIDVSGDYSYYYGLNVAGCDSTAYLTATIEYSNTGSSSAVGCDSLTWDGVTYYSSGVQTNTYTNVAGCDSVHTLDIIINNSYNLTDTHVACNSFTWIDGITYTSSNSIADTLYQSIDGCDSLVTLNLTINYLTTNTDTDTACDTYIWLAPLGDGNTYTASGTYIHSSFNAAGCIHTETLVLTISNSTTGTNTLTTCDTYTWLAPLGDGNTYSTSGTHTHVSTNAAGCHHTETLSLTMNYSSTGFLDTTVCSFYTEELVPAGGVGVPSYTDPLGNNYNTTAIYTFVLTNAVGCDSVVTLDLTVNYPDSSLTTDSACESYTWNGITYTTTDTYYFNTQTVLGCDSIAVLDLFVGYNEINTTTVTTCDNYEWLDANGIIIVTPLNSDSAVSGSVVGNYGLDGLYIDTVEYINQGGCDSIEILNLTITSTVLSTSQAIDIFACDGWMGPDTVYYTNTGIANVVTGTTLDGCDSVQPFNINIAPDKSSVTNITACDSYTWIIATDTSGLTFDTTLYTLSGLYTKTYYVEHTFGGDSTITCDSIAYLDLTINTSTTSTSTITKCDSYTWNGTTYETSGVYTFSSTNSNNCDSTASLYLTINDSAATTVDPQVHCDSYTWIDGNTYSVPVNANSPYINTTATHMLQTVDGCDSLIMLDLTIYPSYSDTLAPEIECDSFHWDIGQIGGGATYYVSGPYTAFFLSSNGCDSLILLDLTIDNAHTYTDTQEHCDTYTWIDGVTYTASDSTATFMYTTVVGGCDSLIYLDLTINYSNTGSTSPVACNTYTWDGVVYTTTGAYTNTYINVAGCDSVHTLNLTINYSNTGATSVTACDSYPWDGVVYDNTGAYANTYTNVAGCDSVHTLNLTIDNTVVNRDTVTSCYDYLWIPLLYPDSTNNIWGFDTTSTFNAGNNTLIYTVLGNSINSTVCIDTSFLYLTINPLEYGADTAVACDSHVWEGNVYIVSGVYVDTIQGTFCDSIATLTLTVNYSNSSTDNVGVQCDEYTWTDGVTYTASNNTATDTFINAALCDSIVTLDLIIVNSTDVFVNVSACDNYYWAVSDTLYTSSGIHSHTYAATNSVGCDSTIWITLTLNNSSIDSVDITACNDFIWDGVVYDSTGSYTNLYSDVNGCDSSVTLNLTIVTGSAGSVNITACDDYAWDGMLYDSTGSYTNLYTDVNGCDSSVTLVLTINNSSSSSVSVTACDNYTWDGMVYDSTGSYTNLYLGTNGCDSTVTLILTINNSSIGSVNITACDNYTWDGVVYDSTGSYTNLYADVNGCDSSVTLNLTIVTGSAGSVNITACDDYTWDGMLYDSTGSYTNLYADVNGCDSSVTLNLTIVTGSAGSVNITACDDYSWDGMLYDSTGSYTNLYTDVNGCDSTVTLNLTINNGSSSSVSDTACDNYTWDGMVYDSTGSYTNVYSGANGCDSTVTLVLTINNGSSSSVSDTACDNYTWDGMVYDSTGSYTNVYADVNGCDSTVTLILTINNSSIGSVNITACDDYTWDGVVYDSTGSYTNVYADVNGCDSVVTLNLTISTAESSIDNVGSHCDSYTWIDGVTYTTSNSIATVDYVNSAGCDSIVTLNLIINDNPVVSISSTNNILSAITTGGTSPYSYLWTGAINSTNAIVTPIASGDYCVQVTDDNGCVSTEVCENVIISTLNELDISKFNIYPNPTSDFVNLEFYVASKADYLVKIITANGDEVYVEELLNFNGDYTKNINLSNLAKGHYLIQIYSDYQVVYRKILLQ
jgi:hypothetical protein